MYKRINWIFQNSAEDVIVFHDDLDVEFGKIKQNLVALVQVIMVSRLSINLLAKNTPEWE